MKNKVKKNNMASFFSSEYFLSEMLEYLPARVFWKDREGLYLGCNAAFARSVLLSKSEDVLGKTDYDLPVKKEDSDAYREDDKEVMRTGMPKLNIEEKQNLENGQEIFLLTSKVPLFDKKGEVIGILGIYSDITEKKQAQEALKQANQARLRFAATASHEVINHVSCVVSFAERLEKNLTALQDILSKEGDAHKKTSKTESISRILSETLEDCKYMRDAAEGGIKTIKNISALQHMQLNKIETYPTLLEIEKFLEVAIRQSTYPNTQHIQIEQSIHPSVPSHVIMDMVNVMAAFGIVIGNAFRFSPPGGKITITVKTLLENKKNYLVISVQDVGAGMHASQIKKLLMPLVKADAEPESLYSKPSVQLSCAKMYLEASQGRLEIESVLNQGTEVKLIVPYNLPAQKKSARKKRIDLVQSKEDAQNEQTKPTHSVLLVEDELITQKLVAQNLVILGYGVDIAKDGAEAIALATANDYAIILLDITLPDMNGLEVMRAIRISKGKDPIFIAVSSHASEEEEDYFLRQGVTTLLAKPVSNEQLKNVIDAALEIKAKLDQGHIEKKWNV